MTVRVAATGITPFGKRSEGLLDLLDAAGSEALAGGGRRPIDLLVVGSMLAGSVGGVENLVPQLADRLGVDVAQGVRADAGSASGAAAFHVGAWAVQSGRAQRALVVAGEKMTSAATPMLSEALARSLAPSEVATGATMPGLAALVAQRYAARFGEEAVAACDAIAAAFRTNASRNPNAQFRSAVSPADVAASRPVAPPLRLLHCAANADGAVAALLERDRGPVTVEGLGQGVDAIALADRLDLTGFRATRLAAQRAYEAARTTRKSLRVAEIHDAFAPFALIDLEDLGFCGPGEGPAYFASGAGASDGVLPLNPSGGVLGRGHPVGASGLAGIVEVCRQIAGEAGPTALPGRPNLGLAQSIGGLGSHVIVTILGAAEADG